MKFKTYTRHAGACNKGGDRLIYFGKGEIMKMNLGNPSANDISKMSRKNVLNFLIKEKI